MIHIRLEGNDKGEEIVSALEIAGLLPNVLRMHITSEGQTVWRYP